MQIVIIHGSPRKGNTYLAAKQFQAEMEKLGAVSFKEFFVPQDLKEPCLGCGMCFRKGREFCPHAQYTLPIYDALMAADAIILTTPVFVYGASGAMKNVLDHLGHIWMAHRPEEVMFAKKAFVLSTTGYKGIKESNHTLVTSLKWWGLNRVYSRGYAMGAADWNQVPVKTKDKFQRLIKKDAGRFYREVAGHKKHRPYFKTWILFHIVRHMKKDPQAFMLDRKYWEEKNWFKTTPFK